MACAKIFTFFGLLVLGFLIPSEVAATDIGIKSSPGRDEDHDLQIARGVIVWDRMISENYDEHLLQVVTGVHGGVTVGYSVLSSALGVTVQVLLLNDNDATPLDDRRSTSGHLFFYGASLITWTSQKQRIVALSSCEAEYIAATAATCQGLWLTRLIQELSNTKIKSMELRVDNKSAIQLIKNPVYHERSKHIDTKFHFIRECLEEKKIEVTHVSTVDQKADILTKALGKTKFEEQRRNLNIKGIQD